MNAMFGIKWRAVGPLGVGDRFPGLALRFDRARKTAGALPLKIKGLCP